MLVLAALVIFGAATTFAQDVNVTGVLNLRMIHHMIATTAELLQKDCVWTRDAIVDGSIGHTPFYPEYSAWWSRSAEQRQKRSISEDTASYVEFNMRLHVLQELHRKLENDYILCRVNGHPNSVYYPHAFTVLKTAVGIRANVPFLVLKVKFRIAGKGAAIESETENWCKDYENLCATYGRRPTGCAGGRSGSYASCGTEYNSKQDFPTKDPLGCNPSGGVCDLAKSFLNESAENNKCFAFLRCTGSTCQKQLRKSASSLFSSTGVYDDGIAYTACF